MPLCRCITEVSFGPDLSRVNFEVNNLKPFPHLAFPRSTDLKTAPKMPSFDGELMASSDFQEWYAGDSATMHPAWLTAREKKKSRLERPLS
jgi:hypothetical protein